MADTTISTEEKSGFEPRNLAQRKSFSELLNDFQTKCESILVDYVKEGYLRTLARVILYLPKEKIEDLLLSFDQDTRQKLEHFMDEGGNYAEYAVDKDPWILEVENAFSSMDFYPVDELTLIEMQRRSESDKEDENEELFNDFTEKNPIYGEYLRKMHLDFAILLSISDLGIQKLLREIDSYELAYALVNTKPEILEKIKCNMSSNAWKMLKDDIDDLNRKLIPKSRISEARSTILTKVQRLRDSGEITINYEDFYKKAVWNEVKSDVKTLMDENLEEPYTDNKYRY